MWCPLPYLVEQLRSLELGKWDKVGSGAMQLLSWSPECCRFGTQLREKKQVLLQSQHFCSRLGHSHRCYPSQLPEKCRKCGFPIKVGSSFSYGRPEGMGDAGSAQPLTRDVPWGKFIGKLLCHQKSSLQIQESPKAPWILGKNLWFSLHPLSFHALFDETQADLHQISSAFQDLILGPGIFTGIC